MSFSMAQKRRYTYEDYLKTPDDKRYELIGGELLMTPSPVPNHQKISREIEFELLKFVKEKGLGEVFYAPCDVHLDDENVVQPDILFISKDRLNIIGEKNIQGAPDIAIEIVSENSAYRDLIQKKGLYATFGVKEFWLVIPKEEMVEIYTFKEGDYDLFKKFKRNDTLESPLLKGLKIDLKKLFE
ncbi:MAG: Uma2 family endonuclease [Nitrospirae bacterium]|nr:Uma2 family endonuclease [Nitrospirota bacterium]